MGDAVVCTLVGAGSLSLLPLCVENILKAAGLYFDSFLYSPVDIFSILLNPLKVWRHFALADGSLGA